MYDLFEFSIRKNISELSIKELVAEYLGVSQKNILTELEYLDLIIKDQSSPLIGITIQHSLIDQGYRTHVFGETTLSFFNNDLLKFAVKASKVFNSEVAIPEFKDTSVQDLFIVSFPNGDIYHAEYRQHDGINDFKLLEKIVI